MRKILAFTSIRSDYDLMSVLFKKLCAEPGFDFRLLVSGAHLSPQHGYSYQHIMDDGIPILAAIETLISGDTHSARLKTASNLLAASIDTVRDFAPEVILIAGDREDVLIGAMLGGFLGIPTVHFFGGDHAADGHIDNPVRHATSKLASAHFVSHDEHAKRLLALGEEPHRIFNIGSIALDKFVAEPHISREQLFDQIGAKPHARTAPRFATLIFHPIAEEQAVAPQYILDTCEVLAQQNFHVFVGAPNTDPGNHALRVVLQQLHASEHVTFYQNLSRTLFINLLRHTSLIAGNSSAGLLEAPTLRIPTINIGLRQRGRLAASSVLFTDGSRVELERALAEIKTVAFSQMLTSVVNPYGDGNSSDRGMALIKTINFGDLLRKSADPLYVD